MIVIRYRKNFIVIRFYKNRMKIISKILSKFGSIHRETKKKYLTSPLIKRTYFRTFVISCEWVSTIDHKGIQRSVYFFSDPTGRLLQVTNTSRCRSWNTLNLEPAFQKTLYFCCQEYVSNALRNNVNSTLIYTLTNVSVFGLPLRSPLCHRPPWLRMSESAAGIST